MKRYLYLLLAGVLVMALTSSALADGRCDWIEYTGSAHGGTTETFYVVTGSSSWFDSKSVLFTLSEGTLCSDYINGIGNSGQENTVAAYEIKVSYQDKYGNWILETNDNTDIYLYKGTDKGYKDNGTYTYTFDRNNTTYKVEIYQWKATTTLWSYSTTVNGHAFGGGTFGGASTDKAALERYPNCTYWSKLPVIMVSEAHNCSIYNICP